MASESEFPGRPAHHDFDVLSKVVRALDARADDTDDTADVIIGETVDADTAVYVASQRGLRMFAETWNLMPSSMRAAVASLWVDGLLAGAGLAAARQEGQHVEGSEAGGQ